MANGCDGCGTPRPVEWCFARGSSAGTVAEGDEVPDLIPVRRAFLVGAPSNWKWLVFDCPCGAGHRIVLNPWTEAVLHTGRSGCREDGGSPSIRASTTGVETAAATISSETGGSYGLAAFGTR